MILINCYFLATSSLGQNRQLPPDYFNKNNAAEIVLKSETNIGKLLNQEGIYLDHGSHPDNIKLYITKEGFEYLKKKNLDYNWEEPVPPVIDMLTLKEYNKKRIQKGNCSPPIEEYPNYLAYEQMMFDFAANYPETCEILNIGTLQSGRKILVAHISDNFGVKEDEPHFLYSSTMHGDELAGYPTMIMLIDHLLCNYGSDDQITKLVNEVDIYINPLANPNGTFFGGNGSVLGSRRFNGAFVDLNRNFPDPMAGTNPDNKPYQEETIIFMDFAKEYEIDLACNIHSGAEVINYPWDTFSHTHADDDWWINVSRDYADTVQSRTTQQDYFTDSSNGITNGFEWFEIKGGRQDYMTYFERAREFTLEISETKQLNSALLPDIWEWNKPALVNYIEESLYGLRGKIVDCVTKEPIEAEVFIEGHDFDNSSVFSKKETGTYFRYLSEGRYDITYAASNYDTVYVDVDIFNKVSKRIDIEMCSVVSSTDNVIDFNNLMLVQENDKLIIKSNQAHSIEIFDTVEIYNLEGMKIHSQEIKGNEILLPANRVQGIYLVQLSNNSQVGSKKIFIK